MLHKEGNRMPTRRGSGTKNGEGGKRKGFPVKKEKTQKERD